MHRVWFDVWHRDGLFVYIKSYQITTALMFIIITQFSDFLMYVITLVYLKKKKKKKYLFSKKYKT